MFKTLRNNNSGVILITVLLLIIVLSIITIGIMSLNVSQVKTSTSVVDSIVEEQLATGLFYQDYQRKFDGNAELSYKNVVEIGDCPSGANCRRYTVTRSETNAPNSPNNTNTIQFNLLAQ